METSDEWIQERTGIKERRWIDPKTSDDTTALQWALRLPKLQLKEQG